MAYGDQYNNLFGDGLAGSSIGPLTQAQSNYGNKYGLSDRQAFGVNQDAINVDTQSSAIPSLWDSGQSTTDSFNTSLYNQNKLGSGNSSLLNTSGSNYDLLSNKDFAAYAGNKGIDINSLDQAGLDNLNAEFMKSKSGTGMTGMEIGQVAIGAGQLGLGLAGYLEDRKTAKAQRGLLQQQLADARTESDTRSKVRSGLASAFGG